MPKITADIPASLNSVLGEEIARTKTDASSIVTAALAQYLRTPIHTLFRVSTSGALIEALKSGHVGGVALDVYEEEEGIFFEDLSGEILQDDELARLLTFPNVLVTAHQAFLTHDALSEIARITVENMRRFVSKQNLLEGTVL